MSSFKTQFVVLILTFKSILMQLFSTFNLSFCNLATVLATFPKIGRFFQTSGHSAQNFDSNPTFMIQVNEKIYQIGQRQKDIFINFKVSLLQL
jgi:hypothetical protein